MVDVRQGWNPRKNAHIKIETVGATRAAWAEYPAQYPGPPICSVRQPDKTPRGSPSGRRSEGPKGQPRAAEQRPRRAGMTPGKGSEKTPLSGGEKASTPTFQEPEKRENPGT